MKKLCPNFRFGDKSRTGGLIIVPFFMRSFDDKTGIIYTVRTFTNMCAVKHLSGRQRPYNNDNGERTAA